MAKVKEEKSIRPRATKRINEYISEAPKFARPICEKLRSIIHQADSEIKEAWRWGPLFNKNGMLCSFGAFESHVSLAFFKGALMKDPKKLLNYGGATRSSRYIRFTSEDEVDENTMLQYLHEAVMINDLGITKPPSSKELEIPADIDTALSANMIARENFYKMTYTHRKEYVDWVNTSRRQETRDNRIMEVVKRSILNQKLKEKSMG